MSSEYCAVCQMIGAPPDLRFCSDHHAYYRADRRLVSVTQVIKRTWPFKPDFSAADPAVLENARERGIAVDELFTAYVRGELEAIPAGTRSDAVDLFFKLRKWWDGHKHSQSCAQVMLGDDTIAGTCDVISDGLIYDLKTTYNIEPSYELQLGAYAQLYWATFGEAVKGVGIIHLSKRFLEPKIIRVDMPKALQDWATLRECYEMAVRRAPNGANKELSE